MSDLAVLESKGATEPARYDLTPMETLNRAVASGASPETLERLLTLQERWERNEARKAYAAALSDFRADVPTIIKTETTDFTSRRTGERTNYKYEDLSKMMGVLSPVLAEHGLSFRYRTHDENTGALTVTCIVSHRDGYEEETSLSAGYDTTGNKNAIQAKGSAVTYLQRYTLKAALGLAAAKDDDGVAVAEEQDAFDEGPWLKRIDACGRDGDALQAVRVEAIKLRNSGGIPPRAWNVMTAHFSAHIKRMTELAEGEDGTA